MSEKSSTDHIAFDYAPIAERSSLIVDTRNAFRELGRPHISRL